MLLGAASWDDAEFIPKFLSASQFAKHGYVVCGVFFFQDSASSVGHGQSLLGAMRNI
jgi:hypothetical protein